MQFIKADFILGISTFTDSITQSVVETKIKPTEKNSDKQNILLVNLLRLKVKQKTATEMKLQ